MNTSGGWYPGKTCTCGAQAKGAPCNTTDCREPWARKYRRSIQPTLWERVVGFFVALFGWG